MSNNYRVLYVEDDAMDQMAFKRASVKRQFRFDFDMVSDCKEALRLLTISSYDLVIADYLLGDGTAFDVIDYCKEIPVIIVTSLGDEEVAVRAMKAGAYDYITKDIAGNYLTTLPVLVERSIQIRENTDALNRYHSNLEAMVEERTQELTKEVEVRLEVQNKNQELAAIVEQLSEGVSVTGLNGDFEYVNRAFESITGYSSVELVGKKAYSFFDIDKNSELIPGIKEALAVGDEWSGELLNQKRNGDYFTERRTLSGLKDSNGDLSKMVSISRDISHEKVMEAHLRQALKKEAIGTLAGGIAHDFNNILYAMMLNITMVQQETKENPGIQKKLQRAQIAGDRAKEIIQQILDFSRKTEETVKDIDFVPVVTGSIVIIESGLSPNVSIKTCFEKPSMMVKANSSILQQVTLNLLTNAVYALPEEGGTIEVILERVVVDASFVELHGGTSGEYVELTVSDTGAGIPESVLNHIFEPFYTTKPINEGTGMGLSVVHGIVTSLNGIITVESVVEQGTRFAVYIPVFLVV
ncbi:MAG: ATP-binding protein [Fibrobacterales bacterium]